MKMTFFLAVVLLMTPAAVRGQSSASHKQAEASGWPKPDFVLHDGKLHPQKPHTSIGADGTFSVSAGTSMIQVSSFSFSADGRLLAVGSTPGIVDVWDVDAKRKVRAFKGGTSVALSPDGRWLVKDGNGIEVVDMSSGVVVRTIPWPADPDHTIESITFDPAAKRILVATNGLDLKVIDVTNGSLVATLTNTRRGAFSIDGSLVVGGDYRHLVTWNVENWQTVRNLPNGPDYVTTVAVDPATTAEVIGGPKSARLVNLTTGAEVSSVGTGYTNFVAFSRTGSKIFTYTSRGLAVWDSKGQQECLFTGNGYYAVALSPDDRWLVAAPANQLTDVAVWNLSEIMSDCSAQPKDSSSN